MTVTSRHLVQIGVPFLQRWRNEVVLEDELRMFLFRVAHECSNGHGTPAQLGIEGLAQLTARKINGDKREAHG